jgi:Na+-driven multidrug efflux pump
MAFVRHTLLRSDDIQMDCEHFHTYVLTHFAFFVSLSLSLFSFMFECIRRYLLSRGLLWPVVVCSSVSAAVTISLTYVLLFVYRMGIEGAAISWVTAQWATMIVYVVCVLVQDGWKRWKRGKKTSVGQQNFSTEECLSARQDNTEQLRASTSPLTSPSPSSSPTPLLHFRDSTGVVNTSPQECSPSASVQSLASNPSISIVNQSSDISTWPSPFDRAILFDWCPLLRLALPGMLSVIMELGAFQCTSVVAARFSRSCLATHSIFLQTTAILYVVPLGFATGSAIAVGQMVGAGRGDRAWDVIKLSYVVHVCYPLFSGGILVIFLRHLWPSLFSSQEGVLAKAASTMPILLLYLFVDHTRCIGKSVLTSCGRSTATAYGHIFSCWIIGLPVIYLFCFPLHMGLLGLWLGMSSAWLSATAIFVVLIFRTDWDLLVEKALMDTRRGQRKQIFHQSPSTDISLGKEIKGSQANNK